MNSIPRENVLKSIIGKHMTGLKPVKYCHVDDVREINAENQLLVAVVDVVTPNGKKIKQTIEFRYTIDDNGICVITAYKIIKEEVNNDE